MKLIKIIFMAAISMGITNQSFSQKKQVQEASYPFSCEVKDGERKMTLLFKSRREVHFEMSEGSLKVSCPFRALGSESKTDKGLRTIRVRFKAAGECSPKRPGAQHLKEVLMLQIEIDKSKKISAKIQHPDFKMAVPCELKDFQLQALGLK